MSTSDTSTQSARLIVSIFAALALTAFVNSHAAWAQDAADADSGDDANWVKVEPTEPAGPAIDEDATSAEKVLEIPQAKCAGDDDDSAACNGAASNNNNDTSDNDQSINAPSPGAPPQTYDQDAYNAPDDWGSVDEYQNQQAYNVPYVVYPSYPTGVMTTVRRPSQIPGSTFAPTNTPLTQAARPPLNQGPWMTPARMSAFNRPAGSPMTPMSMSHPLMGFHH